MDETISRQVKPGSKPYRDRLAALGFREEAVPAEVAKTLIVECGIPPRLERRKADQATRACLG
ncbi:hypothetical protein [Amycolatopsis balhimycina]|uniref:hypothetical protein n=1 Tax=Amycolatopsis balhimycina TaxID=208443 RepID=UPI000F7951E0|nr:hypothetical protein [Amycolatopsis balhimycina]